MLPLNLLGLDKQTVFPKEHFASPLQPLLQVSVCFVQLLCQRLMLQAGLFFLIRLPAGENDSGTTEGVHISPRLRTRYVFRCISLFDGLSCVLMLSG